MAVLGGIESGGTKTVVAVGDSDGVHVEERFPTGDNPEVTMRRCADFLGQHGPVDAVGFGSFGPCDPNPRSKTYGYVTSTPKPGWANTDVVGLLRNNGVSAPVVFDTDVNAAALAEYRHGAGAGSESMLYLTIGTGIGGGLIVNGDVLHGVAHPEVGHQLIASAPDRGCVPVPRQLLGGRERRSGNGRSLGNARAESAGRPSRPGRPRRSWWRSASATWPCRSRWT